MVKDSVEVSAQTVREERRRGILLADAGGIQREADAAAYVAERGFVHLFSPGKLPWPNVSAAELRARGSIETFSLRVWHWKNTLPAAKRCAYGHHLRNRGLFISWRFFPVFRQLWGVIGPVDRVLESDVLAPLERYALQVVAIQGPVKSRDLRREVQALSGASKKQYQLALLALQERFLITVAGGSVEGFSMHDWDLVERHAPPDALDVKLSSEEARARLVCQAIANAPYCTAREIALLFGWERKRTEAVLSVMVAKNALLAFRVEAQKDAGYCVAG